MKRVFFPPLPRQRLYATPRTYLSILYDATLRRAHEGSDVSGLEEDLRTLVAVPHVAAVNQGRVGIYLALRALVVGEKRNVILSPFTIFDVVNMVICAGGRPVFADIRRDSCTIDPDDIERLIDGQTAAVLVTHTHVMCADLDRIAELCRRRNVSLVEDAAVAFGTRHRGHAVGTLGDVGVYSFGLFKNVNGIFGGAVVTRNAELYRRMQEEARTFTPMPLGRLLKRIFYGLAIDVATNPFVFRAVTFWVFRFGMLHDIQAILKRTYNDPNPFLRKEMATALGQRMTNAQARVIRSQLRNVEEDMAKRIRLAEIYHQGLRDIPGILLPPRSTDGSSSFFVFPIQVQHRLELVRHLMRAGRDCALHYYRNVADLECFAEFARNCPNARSVTASVVLLPTYPRYSAEEAEKNVQAVREFFAGRRASSHVPDLGPEADASLGAAEPRDTAS